MLKRFDIRLTILIISLTIILINAGISPLSLIGISLIAILASRLLTAPLRQLIQLADTIQKDDKATSSNIRYASTEITTLQNTLNTLNNRIQKLKTLEKDHAEQLLRDEQRYKIINDLISDYAACVIVDEEGQLYNAWMIGAYTEMLGYEFTDIGAQIDLMAFIHPEDKTIVEQAIKDVLNNKITTCVYRAKHKEGHYIWMEVIRKPVWDEKEARVTGFYSSAQDVSDRMQAQQRLEEREARYKRVSELISDYAAYVRVDAEGELYNGWMIGAYTEMLGFDVPESGAHITLGKFIHPEDVTVAEQAIKGVLNNETTTCIYRAKHKAGHYIWLEVTRQPIWDETEKRVTGFYSATRNINEQTEAQLRLQKNEARYKQVSELMSDYAFYVLIDVDGNPFDIWRTGAYAEILGYDRPQSGAPDEIESFIHPDDIQAVQQDIDQVIFHNQASISIYRAKHKAGHYIWLEVRRQPVWDETEKRVVAFYGAASNVTERIEAQLRLQESEARHKQVSELMSDYAFYVSVDKDGVLRNDWIEGAYTDILGYDIPASDTLVNLDTAIYPDDQVEAYEVIQKTLNNENVTNTYRVKHKAGHYIWLEVTRQPLWDEDEHRVIGFYGAARDVTERMEAQLRLQENESRYRHVSELMSDYTFYMEVDADRNLHSGWVTGAYTDILGYDIPVSGQLGKLDIMHPDDKDMFEAGIQRTLNNERVRASYRIKHKAGHYIWLEANRHPVWDETEKRVIGFYGAARDVTEYMETQLRLQESESRFRTIANTAPIMIWMSDPDDKPLYYNDTWLNFTGYSPGTEKEDGWKEYIHPDDYETVVKASQDGHENQTAFTIEYRFLRQDGEYRWIRENGVPLILENGEFEGFIGTCIDITAQRDTQLELERLVAQQTYELQGEILLRKEVEIQLTRERNLLESTMKASPIAIFLMSNDGKAKFANDAAQQLLPDVSSTLNTNNIFMNLFEAEGDFLLQKTIQSGEALYNQEIIARSAEKDYTVLLNFAPLLTADGKVSEVVITARDITPEREFEEQIQLALQEEKRLNQVRSRFIATITHEFKTPLSVIQTSCDMARRGHSKMTTEQILERFNRIEYQGKRLNNLVDDVVKLNRTNSTDYHVRREVINIPDTIRAIGDDVLHAYQHKASIEYNFQPADHDTNLDAILTYQFLSNLIGNAVKYSHTDGLVLVSSSIKNKYIEITIEDNGIGIPQEDIPYLFSDFFRASNTSNIEGTGLGLAIAKRAIELQSGTIKVESDENEGSCFIIIIPLMEADNL